MSIKLTTQMDWMQKGYGSYSKYHPDNLAKKPDISLPEPVKAPAAIAASSAAAGAASVGASADSAGADAPAGRSAVEIAKAVLCRMRFRQTYCTALLQLARPTAKALEAAKRTTPL